MNISNISLPVVDIFIHPLKAFSKIKERSSLAVMLLLFVVVFTIENLINSYLFPSFHQSLGIVAEKFFDSSHPLTMYSFGIAIAFVGVILWCTFTHFAVKLLGGKGSIKILLCGFLFIISVASVLKLILFKIPFLLWAVCIWEVLLGVACLFVIYDLTMGRAMASFLMGKFLQFCVLGLFFLLFGMSLMMRSFLPKLLEGRLQSPALTATKMPADYNWTIQTLEGEEFPMAEAKGKVVFLNFWATWCTPCVVEMPTIQRLYDQFKEKNVLFISISNENPNKVKKFLKRHEFSFPIYTMKGNPPSVFKRKAIPATFILSPDGMIVSQQEGSAKWDSEETIGFIQGLLMDKSSGGE